MTSCPSVSPEHEVADEEEPEFLKKLMISYLGISFALFLNTSLARRAAKAEEELRLMKSRRREDSRANARVVEIFAGQRNTWQMEKRRLRGDITEREEEIGRLRDKVDELVRKVEELGREVGEREEMINFMSRRGEEDFSEESADVAGFEEGQGDDGAVRFGKERVLDGEEECCYSERGFSNGGEMSGLYAQEGYNFGNSDSFIDRFNSEFLASSNKFMAERPNLWQDVQYESVESMYPMKHFIARESPWKVDGESAGVSSKLKVLEQELLNLERIDKVDPSKVTSLMRKQAKRYQTLAGKIGDLCKRMQASDPCEPTLSPEFRTQRQTEFLLEASRLQQRASETTQKLISLQTETGKSYLGDELATHAKLTRKRSFDSIRNNLKDIQRNLEIWLARIIGDLEGILARDGASHVREYYISRYPFVQ